MRAFDLYDDVIRPIVLGSILSILIGHSCIAKSAEPPPETQPSKTVVKDESGCSNILQAFNGYQLVELRVDPDTQILQALYLKKYSAHKWGLVLLTREECAGPYTPRGEKVFDPKPRTCKPGEMCV